MATAQINARIDSALKESGDRALANAGCSPTKAVRKLWRFASRNAHDPKRLRALLESLEGDSQERNSDEAARERMRRVEEGPLIFERALREMGIENATPVGLSDEELLAQAYYEKWAERGLA